MLHGGSRTVRHLLCPDQRHLLQTLLVTLALNANIIRENTPYYSLKYHSLKYDKIAR